MIGETKLYTEYAYGDATVVIYHMTEVIRLISNNYIAQDMIDRLRRRIRADCYWFHLVHLTIHVDSFELTRCINMFYN